MKSNYTNAVSGPSFLFRSKVARLFPDIPSIHGCWGVKMHEAQMNDSRQNINSIFTSTVDGLIPGMKGATVANYISFKDFIKDSATGSKIEGAVL